MSREAKRWAQLNMMQYSYERMAAAFKKKSDALWKKLSANEKQIAFKEYEEMVKTAAEDD